MGRWVYKWLVEFYDDGLFLKRVYVEAKTKTEAIHKVAKDHKIIELRCCIRADRWY